MSNITVGISSLPREVALRVAPGVIECLCDQFNRKEITIEEFYERTGIVGDIVENLGTQLRTESKKVLLERV